jgi:hypothetical protein
MLARRDLVPNGSATAKALNYRLKRWVALTVAQLNSTACEQDHLAPVVTTSRGLVLGLLTLFLLIGFRHTRHL